MFLEYTDAGPKLPPDGPELEEHLGTLLRVYTRQHLHIRFLAKVARDRGIQLRRTANPPPLLKEEAETLGRAELDALDYFATHHTGEILDLLLMLKSLTRPQIEEMATAAEIGVAMRSCGSRPWSRARFYVRNDDYPALRSNSRVVDVLDGVVRAGRTMYGLTAVLIVTAIAYFTASTTVMLWAAVAAFVGWFVLQGSNDSRIKRDQLDSETLYASTLTDAYTAMVVADIDHLKHRARAATDRLVTTLEQHSLSELDRVTSTYLHHHISTLFYLEELNRIQDILDRASVDSPDIEELRNVHDAHLDALAREHRAIREAVDEAIAIVDALETEAADDAAQIEAVRYLRERRLEN